MENTSDTIFITDPSQVYDNTALTIPEGMTLSGHITSTGYASYDYSVDLTSVSTQDILKEIKRRGAEKEIREVLNMDKNMEQW